jgi:hypothetical protein
VRDEGDRERGIQDPAAQRRFGGGEGRRLLRILIGLQREPGREDDQGQGLTGVSTVDATLRDFGESLFVTDGSVGSSGGSGGR